MATSYYPALVEELLSQGCEEYYLDESGRHNKLRFRWGGRLLLHVFPKTGSDRRGLLNSLADLRRSMGVSKILQKAAPQEQIPKHPVARPKQDINNDLTITVAPDPFAGLAALLEPPPMEIVQCPRMSLAQMAAMLNSARPFAS